MITSKVEICGVNTSKLPILNNEQKKILFDKILQGDTKARQEYIYGNLRLVLSVIKRFNNRGENMDDLFQVGCIGLMKAIDNFDISQGVRFSTYAVPMNVLCRNILRCLQMAERQGKKIKIEVNRYHKNAESHEISKINIQLKDAYIAIKNK